VFFTPTTNELGAPISIVEVVDAVGIPQKRTFLIIILLFIHSRPFNQKSFILTASISYPYSLTKSDHPFLFSLIYLILFSVANFVMHSQKQFSLTVNR